MSALAAALSPGSSPVLLRPKLERSEWLPDELAMHCYGCGAEFTLIRRRHHCRLCGNCFCAGCSHRKMRHRKLQTADNAPAAAGASGSIFHAGSDEQDAAASPNLSTLLKKTLSRASAVMTGRAVGGAEEPVKLIRVCDSCYDTEGVLASSSVAPAASHGRRSRQYTRDTDQLHLDSSCESGEEDEEEEEEDDEVEDAEEDGGSAAQGLQAATGAQEHAEEDEEMSSASDLDSEGPHLSEEEVAPRSYAEATASLMEIGVLDDEESLLDLTGTGSGSFPPAAAVHRHKRFSVGLMRRSRKSTRMTAAEASEAATVAAEAAHVAAASAGAAATSARASTLDAFSTSRSALAAAAVAPSAQFTSGLTSKRMGASSRDLPRAASASAGPHRGSWPVSAATGGAAALAGLPAPTHSLASCLFHRFFRVGARESLKLVLPDPVLLYLANKKYLTASASVGAQADISQLGDGGIYSAPAPAAVSPRAAAAAAAAATQSQAGSTASANSSANTCLLYTSPSPRD